MKRLLWIAACFAVAAAAQTPIAPAPAAPAQHGSNETDKVDVDRFMGYADNRTVHLSHGTLLTHSILRAGNPYEPGPQGAVLEYRKDLSTATLLPNSRTPLSTLPDEYFSTSKAGRDASMTENNIGICAKTPRFWRRPTCLTASLTPPISLCG